MSGNVHYERLLNANVCFIENGFDSPARRFFLEYVSAEGGNVRFTDQPLARLLDRKEYSECLFVYAVYEPLTYLRMLFRFYYEQGGPDGFVFYRKFRRAVDQLDLMQDDGVKALVSWLKKNSVMSVYNPQAAGIDSRKNLNRIEEYCEGQVGLLFPEVALGRLQAWMGLPRKAEEDAAPKSSEGISNPFDAFPIHDCEGLFAPFVEKDNVLYETAKQKFEFVMEKGMFLDEYRALVKQYRGVVGIVESKMVAGWGYAIDKPPVSIVLAVNGEVVAKTMADKYRKDLLQKGIHPDGKCGFVFKLDTMKLSSSDNIEVWFEEAKVPLKLVGNALEFFRIG